MCLLGTGLTKMGKPILNVGASIGRSCAEETGVITKLPHFAYLLWTSCDHPPEVHATMPPYNGGPYPSCKLILTL